LHGHELKEINRSANKRGRLKVYIIIGLRGWASEFKRVTSEVLVIAKAVGGLITTIFGTEEITIDLRRANEEDSAVFELFVILGIMLRMLFFSAC
jgi:hypothetical protein